MHDLLPELLVDRQPSLRHVERGGSQNSKVSQTKVKVGPHAFLAGGGRSVFQTSEEVCSGNPGTQPWRRRRG